ncbi:L-xylulose reductase-like, partial [Rhagoletis pomonella]|uniref:L-xylulose reductase-like n=1 Tax=Rhagoletis pomonella TaxID=28610 RepID=UPI0017856580
VEQFDSILNTNLRSVFLLTKFAATHLVKTQGNIVNVSSVAGLRSFPNTSSYCTSKAALDQFTRCIALDLAPKQVRVNAVNPGVVVTDIHKRSGMSAEEYAKYLEHHKETHALGRVGSTKEVADAIIFFASDTASFITGATLPIDGGKHAMCPR